MISVCIATYNGEHYIERQLRSILSQLGPTDEVVISDDGSTDGTLSVVRAIASPLIHIYVNEGDHGYTPNFENALRHATGDIIFLADQDDEWCEGKVKTMMQLLQTHALAVSDAVVVDDEGRTLAPSFYAERQPRRTWLGNVIKFGYLGCCMAFRREVLKRALPFPANHVLCTHDNWLFLVAKTYYKVAISDARLIRYCRHAGAISSGTENAGRSPWFRIHYRLYLMRHLLQRALR